MGITGVCLGSMAAIALTGVLRDVLVPGHVSVFYACFTVAALWLIVVTAASYVPAMHSSHVEPPTALRYD